MAHITTSQRVPNADPDLITRFKFRAERRCRNLNSELRVPFYRWEVHDWLDGRWAVVAMQNVAIPENVVVLSERGGKVKCACGKCSTMISKDDYTFPYCVQCYANIDGVCT